MTLTGQECRIQALYRLPEHPQIDHFKKLNEDYKKISLETKIKYDEAKKVIN